MPDELVLVEATASYLGARVENSYGSDEAYVGVPAATAMSVADILSPMVNGSALYGGGDYMLGAGLFCVIYRQWFYIKSSAYSTFSFVISPNNTATLCNTFSLKHILCAQGCSMRTL